MRHQARMEQILQAVAALGKPAVQAIVARIRHGSWRGTALSNPPPTLRSAAGPPIVALRDVAKTFANGVAALAGLDLDVRPGEFVALLGPSGCGKSTALRLIAGLSEPTAGTITWRGNRSARSTAHSGAHDIGFVFQEPTLMPWTTVARNVDLPLRLDGASSAAATPRVAA